MNFLAGPHAYACQQMQQQQQPHQQLPPCSGLEACPLDLAGQDLSAIAQESEDKILDGQQLPVSSFACGSDDDYEAEADGEEIDDDDDEEEEEDEDGDCEGEDGGAKEAADGDSQAQNLSSSSESDELINPKWDEKMWRTVAHRPNHPFQKKAQQVTMQRALGDEEAIDNDTIAGKGSERERG